MLTKVRLMSENSDTEAMVSSAFVDRSTALGTRRRFVVLPSEIEGAEG